MTPDPAYGPFEIEIEYTDYLFEATVEGPNGETHELSGYGSGDRLLRDARRVMSGMDADDGRLVEGEFERRGELAVEVLESHPAVLEATYHSGFEELCVLLTSTNVEPIEIPASEFGLSHEWSNVTHTREHGLHLYTCWSFDQYLLLPARSEYPQTLDGVTAYWRERFADESELFLDNTIEDLRLLQWETGKHAPTDISETDLTLSEAPRFAGTTISVFNVVRNVRERGMQSADDFEHYPQLTDVQIETALAYADANPDWYERRLDEHREDSPAENMFDLFDPEDDDA